MLEFFLLVFAGLELLLMGDGIRPRWFIGRGMEVEADFFAPHNCWCYNARPKTTTRASWAQAARGVHHVPVRTIQACRRPSLCLRATQGAAAHPNTDALHIPIHSRLLSSSHYYATAHSRLDRSNGRPTSAPSR